MLLFLFYIYPILRVNSLTHCTRTELPLDEHSRITMKVVRGSISSMMDTILDPAEERLRFQFGRIWEWSLSMRPARFINRPKVQNT